MISCLKTDTKVISVFAHVSEIHSRSSGLPMTLNPSQRNARRSKDAGWLPSMQMKLASPPGSDCVSP